MTFTARRQTIRTEADIVVALSRLRGDVLELGFSGYGVTRVVTAASELARNILKYAGAGHIAHSKLVDGAKLGVEVVARDEGPGIADVDQAMADHYSSSGTLGLGLPGVKRMVDEFEVSSDVGAGTTVTFKVWVS